MMRFARLVVGVSALLVAAAASAGDSKALHEALQNGHGVPELVSDEELACLAEGDAFKECFAKDSKGEESASEGEKDFSAEPDDVTTGTSPLSDLGPDDSDSSEE